MDSKAGKIFVHITGCLLFLALPLFFAPGSSFSLRTFTNPFMLREFLSYLMMIGFFYLNVLLLIPKLYLTKKYVYFFATAIISFFCVTLIPYLLIEIDAHQPPPPPGGPPESKSILFELGHNFFAFFVVIFISLTIVLRERWRKSERERLNAELSYLKAQINPHFLFNTLNSIYSLAIEKSDYTATAVVKLSAMMRYVVTEAHHDFVSLEKEINYVRDYIDLHQIRFGDTIHLSFTTKGDMSGKKIAPLVVIPFVENAFKHGVNAEENSNISVSIDIQSNILQLEVANKKVSTQMATEHKSGVGIENTRNRLNLLYPSGHSLVIRDNDSDFVVSLTLHLQ